MGHSTNLLLSETQDFDMKVFTPNPLDAQCIKKFPDLVNNEINNNNKHSLRNNTKGYGGRTH
jgi:hypothetical protein